MTTERVGANYKTGDRIKELRINAGYSSAAQFAKMNGWEYRTFNRLEQGVREPHCDEIRELRSQLKCTYKDIIG